MYRMLNDLYDDTLDLSDKKPLFLLPDKIKERILKKIFDHFDVKNDIIPELFEFSFEALNKGIEDNFTPKITHKENTEFLEALRSNTAVFAAFKAHRQQNDLATLLLDDKGKVKSFANFKADSERVIGSYNTHWLQNEYDAAIKGARTAALFADFEQDKDIAPNIRWMPSTSVEPRDIHKAYYGMVRSKDDPFWRTNFPGMLWGCKCGIEQTSDIITHKKGEGQTTTASKGLEINPYYAKRIFSDKHPYVKEAYPGADQAVKSFVKQAAVSSLVDQTLTDKRAKGEKVQVGTMDKSVVKFLKGRGIKLETTQITLYDQAVMHMSRTAKSNRHANPSPDHIKEISSILERADIWFDEKLNNLIYAVKLDEEMSLKFVVAQNYKKKKDITNYVVTGGIVESYNITDKVYIKIRKGQK